MAAPTGRGSPGSDPIGGSLNPDPTAGSRGPDPGGESLGSDPGGGSRGPDPGGGFLGSDPTAGSPDPDPDPTAGSPEPDPTAGSPDPDPTRGPDPGAAPYGNFPNYSRFHPPEGRVRLLPPGLLRSLFPERPRPLLGLDVGCNSGELSLALYRRLLDLPAGQSIPSPAAGRELNLLCCDIDAGLIGRARRGCPFPESLISFVPLDIMDREARRALLGSHLRRFGRRRFDLVCCLSVTMWIHLRHGDRGLREFLAFLASAGSVLLLEPQPWKCYRAAARRLRRAGRDDFEHFRGLGIRGDVEGGIGRILSRECSMESLGCLGSTDWNRSLLLFRATREQPLEWPLEEEDGGEEEEFLIPSS